MKLLLRFAIWGALALAVLVGLTEAVLWLAAPVAKRAPLTYRFENQLPGLKEKVEFRINEYGLRTWEAPQENGKPLHLLCIGGAATTALLQNDEDTWWGQLGSLLQKEFPDRKVKVSALLRDDGPLLFAARWAHDKLPEIKPDVVLVMGGFGDVVSQPADYHYDAEKINKLPSVDGSSGGLKNFLLDISQLARRYSHTRQRRMHLQRLGPLGELNAYAKLLAQTRAAYAQLPVRYESDRKEGQDPAFEFIDALNVIASSAKAVGAGIIFIGEPTLQRGLLDPLETQLLHRWFFLKGGPPTPETVVRLDPGWVELEMRRYYASMEKLANTLKAPFLNPERHVPASAMVFVDDTMFTDAGAASFAQLVLPVVKPVVEARP